MNTAVFLLIVVLLTVIKLVVLWLRHLNDSRHVQNDVRVGQRSKVQPSNDVTEEDEEEEGVDHQWGTFVKATPIAKLNCFKKPLSVGGLTFRS